MELGDVVAAGGDALGRLPDGRVLFCEGGLPGETVTVEVVAERRDYARGRVSAVVRASPDRVVPPCPNARAGCGGCQLQHAAPGAQLRAKETVVADSLRRLAGMDLPPGPPPVALAPEAYRTSLRMAVDGDGRPAFRRRHGTDTLAVDTCLVAHRLLVELLTSVRMRPAGGPARPGARGADRRSGGRRTGRSRGGEAPAAEVGLRIGVEGGERLVVPTGRAVVVEAPVDAVVVGPTTPGHLHERAGGRRWRVSAGSFFQSGPAAADLLSAAVAEAVGDLAGTDTLVDLYAGVGLLGGVLAARSGCRLVAVEAGSDAADDARHNLADVGATVEAVAVDRWEPVDAGVVVADPARPGLGRPGVAAAVATGARRVVLVSCDPASGARDAALLRDRGYEAVRLAVVDLFPHTAHVETVATFDRH